MLTILDWLNYLFTGLILANVLISWVPQLKWSGVGRWIFNLGEAMSRPFKRWLRPLRMGGVGLDFSLVACYFAGQIVFFLVRELVKMVGIH